MQSLHAPASELKQIVGAMEKEAAALVPRLKMNAAVWLGELERLRSMVRLNALSGRLTILPSASALRSAISGSSARRQSRGRCSES